jgi:hypothetical protein
MFEFLGRGKAKADKSAADAGPSTLAQTVQLSATQREMVRMTLHGVLKLNGIPGNWIAGEVIPVRIPGKGEALLIQLEVMHWHDTLVLHAPAFQKELLEGLSRFDPHTDRAHYLFAWKFSPDCRCPHTAMPDPGFWSSHPSPRLGPVAAKAAIKRPPPPVDNGDDDDDNGFAATQLNDLR